MAQALSPDDFAGRYSWAISNVNLNATREIKLTSIKKYWRYAIQVEIEIDWLYNWFLVLATIMRYLHRE